MPKPVLVLQMQRMGDLILSFPLFLWLKQLSPESRTWVVAEKTFYEGLVDVSPGVLYIPWEAYAHVLKHKFSLVINLSHRREAAWLAGKVKAEKIVGPYLDANEALRVAGDWQLYRFSLVHNNRYNRFHWAELNALDVVQPAVISRTRWPGPRSLGKRDRIGVFIGASQDFKRPGPDFFALLCKKLIQLEYKPVLLGGKNEKQLAKEILARCSVKPLNLAGKLGLARFAGLLSGLSLLITPDTGPMHLGAWSGLKTLNLSLGPVNPWETGPYQPGHLVVRSNVSCTGCWQCVQKEPLCSGSFRTRQIIQLMEKMLAGQVKNTPPDIYTGLNIYQTARKKGLYNLVSLVDRTPASSALGSFWQSYWKYLFGMSSEGEVALQNKNLAAEFPLLHDKLTRSCLDFLTGMKAIISRGQHPDENFWKEFLPCFRPFTGYAHLVWQNEDYSQKSLNQTIRMVQDLLHCLFAE